MCLKLVLSGSIGYYILSSCDRSDDPKRFYNCSLQMGSKHKNGCHKHTAILFKVSNQRKFARLISDKYLWDDEPQNICFRITIIFIYIRIIAQGNFLVIILKKSSSKITWKFCFEPTTLLQSKEPRMRWVNVTALPSNIETVSGHDGAIVQRSTLKC